MPIAQQLKDKIQNFANLPTLPQVATRLMSVINNPLTSASDVAAIIGQDLSLSAKVLRLANSAFYGIPRTITSINNAVVVLGLKVINTMVLSLTVFDMFPENRRIAKLFDRKAFWLHSLTCGLIAKHLAYRIRSVIPFDPEEAFCSGLLHDIGKVVMEQYLHEDFHSALEFATSEGIPIHCAERSRLGYAHTDVAEWLTENWSLPPEIRSSLMYHHDPESTSDYRDMVSLCHVADWLCYETGMTIDGKYQPPELQRASMNLLTLQPRDIDDVKALVAEELEKTSLFYTVAAEQPLPEKPGR